MTAADRRVVNPAQIDRGSALFSKATAVVVVGAGSALCCRTGRVLLGAGFIQWHAFCKVTSTSYD